MSTGTERPGRSGGRWPAVASALRLVVVALVMAFRGPLAAQDAALPVDVDAEASTSWQDEELPPCSPEQAAAFRQITVDRIAVQPRGVEVDQLGAADSETILAAIAEDFGVALRPVGPVASLGYFELRLPRRMGYEEAAKRCRRTVRYGDAIDCRPLSSLGALL